MCPPCLVASIASPAHAAMAVAGVLRTAGVVSVCARNASPARRAALCSQFFCVRTFVVRTIWCHPQVAAGLEHRPVVRVRGVQRHQNRCRVRAHHHAVPSHQPPPTHCLRCKIASITVFICYGMLGAPPFPHSPVLDILFMRLSRSLRKFLQNQSHLIVLTLVLLNFFKKNRPYDADW